MCFEYLVVGANAGGLPGAVVARRIRLVELETIGPVPPGVNEGHTKWPET